MIKLFLASPCCMELNLAKIEKVPEKAMKGFAAACAD